MKYKSFNTELILALLIALPAFVILLSVFSILYRSNFQISSLKFIGIGSVIYFPLVFLVWKNTYYKIESGILYLRDFGIINKSIAIDQIITIKIIDKKPKTPTQPGLYNTNNNISGLLIHTETNGTLFVSPIKEAALLTELRKWNPAIEYIGGKKGDIPTAKK
ncbi:hypothetical protein [Tunicatimonas pelagia]|uniref:hypothetical protein n=1 Tax=Tunicatimonas pelagia TaxID=931531 RepID=UPI0026657B3E|nr:hypothetical protein [Tunicatimonas pelagia]WKN40759.1 hypothetical protein P0M28_17115 [Tunicatimonas pelagia]